MRRKVYRMPEDLEKLSKDLKIPFYDWAIIWGVDHGERYRDKTR